MLQCSGWQRYQSPHSNSQFGTSLPTIQPDNGVDNRFYALWLDPTLSYSCAMFDRVEDDLHTAQLKKIEYIARAIHVQDTHRLLDIGCGWGGLLHRLKSAYGVRDTVGLTLSQQQLRHIRGSYGDAHDVSLGSWETHDPWAAPYDAITSVGALEHFAKPTATPAERLAGYRGFFARCHNWLRPGGRMFLQTVCYDLADRRDLPAFFRESVFPMSDLPRPSELLHAVDGLFHVEVVRNDSDHYTETLHHWRSNLRSHFGTAQGLIGTTAAAHYMKYLVLSQVSSHRRATGLLRLTLCRTDRSIEREVQPLKKRPA